MRAYKQDKYKVTKTKYTNEDERDVMSPEPRIEPSIEPRLAKIEARADSIDQSLKDIKTDIRDLRTEISSTRTSFETKFNLLDGKIDSLRNTMGSNFKWILGIIITVSLAQFGGIITILSKLH